MMQIRAVGRTFAFLLSDGTTFKVTPHEYVQAPNELENVPAFKHAVEHNEIQIVRPKTADEAKLQAKTVKIGKE